MLLPSHSVDSTNTSASSSLQCSYAIGNEQIGPFPIHTRPDVNPYVSALNLGIEFISYCIIFMKTDELYILLHI